MREKRDAQKAGDRQRDRHDKADKHRDEETILSATIQKELLETFRIPRPATLGIRFLLFHKRRLFFGSHHVGDGRHKSERHEYRSDKDDVDRKGNGGDEFADDAGDEKERHKKRDGGHRAPDKRPRVFPQGFDRRFFFVAVEAGACVYGFDDDDAGIDKNTDSQNEGEKRDDIQCVAGIEKPDEGDQKRKRYREPCHERFAPPDRRKECQHDEHNGRETGLGEFKQIRSYFVSGIV